MQKIIKGKVVEGKKRGKDLGFPTANIILNEKIEEGIYVSCTKFDNQKLSSLTFIGAAITYDEEIVQAETHILDFSESLYNKKIEIELLEKIRDNIKFESEKELIAEMENDKKKALKYFKENV